MKTRKHATSGCAPGVCHRVHRVHPPPAAPSRVQDGVCKLTSSEVLFCYILPFSCLLLLLNRPADVVRGIGMTHQKPLIFL
jgi:hypothetical protein